MMEIKTTIAGAGIIGLSIASELSKSIKDIFVIEKNDRFGMETSSRNSEVIHAGIYYPQDSLKARLCLEGNRLLYERCLAKRIKHIKCGKLIVANSVEEELKLNEIKENAFQNGVEDLELLTEKKTNQLEPSVNAKAAIFSPSTGIIDSHKLMGSLFSHAKNNGVNFIFGTEVKSVKIIQPGKYQVDVIYPDGKPFSFISSTFINCAGHFSDKLAQSMGIDIDAAGYRQHFWKGEYFSVDTKPFQIKRLVYPVPLPQNTGLGIHATIDVSGKLKLGPNATFIENGKIDYSVNPNELDSFYESAVKFLPFIKKKSIKPEMAGVRPKLQRPGDPARDFIINEESDKNLPGIVNLIGIESPGLTSCLAISKHVYELIKYAL